MEEGTRRTEGREKEQEEGWRETTGVRGNEQSGAEECSNSGRRKVGGLKKEGQSDTQCSLSPWIQQTLMSNVSLPLCG